MPKYTNNFCLPEAVVRAMTSDVYSKDGADFSVTELMRPHWMARLEKQHQHEIEMEVTDTTSRFIGTAIHKALELGAPADAVSERRFILDIDGIRVGCKPDLYEPSTKRLIDYKTTTVSGHQYGTHLDDWECQLSCNAAILSRLGHEVYSASIVAFYVDYRPAEAERDKGYPVARVVEVQMPLWPTQTAIDWLRARAQERKAALEGTCLPCTNEERWGRPAVWAVVEKGKSRAKKLFETEDEACLFAANLPVHVAASVQKRPSRFVRCEKYCDVRAFCPCAVKE